MKAELKTLKEGDLVVLEYQFFKKIKTFVGFFYHADLPNKLIGSQILLSDVPKDQWGWVADGYNRGFRLKKIVSIKKITY